MDYRTKPVRVEAVEWNPEKPRHPEAEWMPNWFHGAIDPKYGNARLCGKIKQLGENLQVVTDNGMAIAKPGDWLVY